MFFKKVKYFFYLTHMRLCKGSKHRRLLKQHKIEEAREYVKDTLLHWSKYTIDTIGLDIHVSGLENIPEEPCVFISNHSSILDIPIILHTSKKATGFIAKQELQKIPFLGYWIKNSGSVFLDRQNPRSAVTSINQGVSHLNDGLYMGIFPEGTRSKDGNIAPFKKGSFKLATKAKAKIVPIYIENASRAYEDTKQFNPCKISIVYGKPIDTFNLTKDEEQKLAERVYNIINTELKSKI